MKSETLSAMARYASGAVHSPGGSTSMSNAEHKASAIFQFAEIQGSAFATAYANGRWGTQGELMIPGTPAPADLTVSLGLHLAQFLFGLFGNRNADHVHNVADGIFSNYSVRAGMNLGLSHKGSSKVQGTHGVRYNADGTVFDDNAGNRASA